MAIKVSSIPVDAPIGRIAARQHGVVSRRQLLAAGATGAAVQGRVAAGLLVPVHRGVYSVGIEHPARHGRWMAAVLAAGPNSVLSHAAAATLWELMGESSEVVDVTVPPDRRRNQRPGLRVHRRPLRDTERVLFDGIPVTSPTRALLDVAADLEHEQLSRAVDEARFRKRATTASLRATLRNNPGRTGAPALRAVVDEQERGFHASRTVLETRFRAICRRGGLPRPQSNVILLGRERDFYWPYARLAVEVDGWASHNRRSTSEDDHRRDVDLKAAGYEVLRFTYLQVTYDGDWVLSSVRQMLAARAA